MPKQLLSAFLPFPVHRRSQRNIGCCLSRHSVGPAAIIAVLTFGITAPCYAAAGFAQRQTPVPAEAPSTWEQQKWRSEHQLKVREFDLKVRELDLKEQEQQRSRWSNPLVVAILAATVAGFGSAAVAVINGWQQRDLEKNKADEALQVEKNRSEAERILEMIKTGEPDKAAGNLQFLIKMGLISDTALVQRIDSYLIQRKPGTGPFLPTGEGRYLFTPSSVVNELIVSSVEKSLNDFITYLDKLELKGPSERISIEVVKSDSGVGHRAFYATNPPRVVINETVVRDLDPPRRAYVIHILSEGHVDRIGISFNTLRSGMAWYLPCSFAGRSAFGEETARALELDRRNIGDLGERMQYEEPSKTDWSTYTFVGGAVWGSMLWEIRTRLGQPVADVMAVKAWLNTAAIAHTTEDGLLARKFNQELIAAAGSVSMEARNMVNAVLADRSFPV